MQVGLVVDGYLSAPGVGVLDMIDRVAANGFDGVVFASVAAISPGLDPVELRAARARADHHGLFWEVGIGRIGTATRSLDLSHARALTSAALSTGSTEITTYTGLDRFHKTVPWVQQIDAVVDLLSRLVPFTAEEGAHLNLETHEDLTSHDVLAIIERVTTGRIGVTYDPANAVVRGEDPVAVLQRLAPHVRQTQLEDVTLTLSSGGMMRHLNACGEGIIDFGAVVDLLANSPARLVIEQHRGQFTIDLLVDAWAAAHPDLNARESAALLREAMAASRRDGGHLVVDDTFRTRNDAELDRDLNSSIRYLRSLSSSEPA